MTQLTPVKFDTFDSLEAQGIGEKISNNLGWIALALVLIGTGLVVGGLLCDHSSTACLALVISGGILMLASLLIFGVRQWKKKNDERQQQSEGKITNFIISSDSQRLGIKRGEMTEWVPLEKEWVSKLNENNRFYFLNADGAICHWNGYSIVLNGELL